VGAELKQTESLIVYAMMYSITVLACAFMALVFMGRGNDTIYAGLIGGIVAIPNMLGGRLGAITRGRNQEKDGDE
jgi:hypothetical protein